MTGPANDVPTGTVTFLFSDVVGSTKLWAKDAIGMSNSLQIHDHIFIDAISRFGGVVFATAGDSFAAAFPKASLAVECATAIQTTFANTTWGSGPALQVRIGMHVGEAEERDGNYFGLAVSQAARVMAVAHGGQCILTDGVRDAAAVTTTDLGTHLLRGIEAPVHLNQLGSTEFPPLWSVGVGIVSLPSPRTSLIGRDEAVEEIRKVAAAHRLVTLVGVGGGGKTRLAIEVAYREIPTHPDGIWFVDLSTTANSAGLTGAFASSLDLSIATNTPAIDQIAAYLAPRQALLIVDNCEQVVDSVAEFLDQLLAKAPKIHVITTTREILGIHGEFAWKVPSLSTGVSEAAVELFFERANAVGATLQINDETRTIVADIVQHLDGIPLAIELAAARSRSMDLTDVRDRLGDRFRLLTSGSRGTSQRQSTLEGAVHWSYDLLSEPERSLLQVLSVFQGGFNPTDVAAVAEIAEYEAIDLIESLANKSLVDVTRDIRGRVRQRLLETIRMFALSQLIEAGAADEVRDRHLEHFCNDPSGESFNAWLALESITRLGREYENFRSAATWALERGRPEATVRIVSMGHEAGAQRGEVELVISSLRLEADLSPHDRINACISLAYELLWLGDLGGVSEATAQALAINEEFPCDFAVQAMLVDGIMLGVLGQHGAMVAKFESALQLARENYGPAVQALLEFQLGWSDVLMLRYPEALERLESSIKVANISIRHIIEANRAWALVALGRVDEAAQAVENFCEVPIGSQWEFLNLQAIHIVMGHQEGPDEAARSLARQARELVARQPQIASTVVQVFAYLAHLRGDEERVIEITSSTLPIHGEQLWNWLVLRPLGANADNFNEIRAQYEADHPLFDRFVVDAENGRRLLDEEIARWS